MRVKLLALADNPLVDRMRNAARDLDHNGLGHLVRHHRTDFLVLIALLGFVAHRYLPFFVLPLAAGAGPASPEISRSRRTVSIRARSLRSFQTLFKPSICPIDIWNRSRNTCSFESLNCFWIAAVSRARTLSAFSFM